jgi:hypothetical protein
VCTHSDLRVERGEIQMLLAILRAVMSDLIAWPENDDRFQMKSVIYAAESTEKWPMFV